MALHVPTAGRQVLILNGIAAATTVHLFQNDHTPVDGDTPSSYTEANFEGYSAMGIGSGGWSISGGNLQPMTATYATPLTWTNSSATTGLIYGYWVGDGTNVLWAELWGSVYSPTPGATITLNLIFTLASLT